MKILVACEKSGVVREAFRQRGHQAFSCDLLPADDGSVFHFQEDAKRVMKKHPWDLVIAHPPCTRLCNSGVLRLYRDGKKRNGVSDRAWQEMERGARFFRFFLEAGRVMRISVENPIMHGYARAIIGFGAVERQTVQPYQFGDDASKATVLWLRNLPPLEIDPGNYCKPRMVCGECGARSSYSAAFGKGCPHCGAEAGLLRPRWANQTDSGQNRLPPSAGRAAERAKTYRGIANAMAEQWGSL